jgi:hypothetical protein
MHNEPSSACRSRSGIPVPVATIGPKHGRMPGDEQAGQTRAHGAALLAAPALGKRSEPLPYANQLEGDQPGMLHFSDEAFCIMS